jgi:GTPase
MYYYNKKYMLIDVAEIKIQAGKGGDGKVSFRREKFIPKGGPDGGDGGKGGSVIFVADNNMATLLDFRAKPLFKAEEGQEGGKKKMSGQNGMDLYIKIPVGTLIYEIQDSREVLIQDMDSSGKQYVAAIGGVGGKGNWRFRSSINQTPVQYTEGTPGELKDIKLEIKLVADVGFVGTPSAGKSTLLNKLTKANAKIGDYPFTTLSPNLGTCLLPNGKTVVLADIPGLIEGASQGKGLGDEFLRHIERTRILAYIIDPLFISEGDFLQEDKEKENIYVKSALKSYEMLQNELKNYGHNLPNKESLIVINKLDLTEVQDSFLEIKDAFKKNYKVEVIGISAATGQGVEDLLNKLTELLAKLPEKVSFNTVSPVKLFNISNLPNSKMVFRTQKVKEKPKPRADRR